LARVKVLIVQVQAAASNLLGIINDILDFSKIEAGKMEMETIPFRLDEVLDNLANIVVIRAGGKGLEVLFDLHSDVPLDLLGDPLRLGQILINLVNNAIKFTHRGEVIVTVALADQDEKTVALCCTVRDSGIGLTSEQISRLFQSFSQAEGSHTRKYCGTGASLIWWLIICKRMVEGGQFTGARGRRGAIKRRIKVFLHRAPVEVEGLADLTHRLVFAMPTVNFKNELAINHA
jgi:K+-sensing histidine kinase KdpD